MRLSSGKFHDGCSRTKNGGTLLVLPLQNIAKVQQNRKEKCRTRFVFCCVCFGMCIVLFLFSFYILSHTHIDTGPAQQKQERRCKKCLFLGRPLLVWQDSWNCLDGDRHKGNLSSHEKFMRRDRLRGRRRGGGGSRGARSARARCGWV